MALPREDLKEFQARVAERLRVAREQGVAASWLAVGISGLNCLFPLSQANEVIPSAAIIPVPYAKPWFMGAINSRGRIYGVVGLSDYLVYENRQEFPLNETSIALPEYSLIALNAALNLNCVLMVNKVMGLRTIENFSNSVPPAADAPDCFGLSYRDVAGSHWQEINLQNLSRSLGFLSIRV